MGLFGRDDRLLHEPPKTPAEPAARPHPSPANAAAKLTVVAAPTRVEGAVSGSGDVHVEGEVKGSVTSSARILVAESGRVEAALHGRTVVVAGSVVGDVTADERIELKPSARLTGNITAPRILIEDGASFEGKVEMKKPKGRPATADPAPADTTPKTSSARKATDAPEKRKG